jgi:predicted Rdx family selenoprotein
LDVKVTREYGKLGQFDVVVDGVVVASRGGSMLRKLLAGGFPDPEEVIQKIEALQQARK